jgi:hypothetical protein
MTTGEIILIIAGLLEALATVGSLVVMIVALKRVTDVNVTNKTFSVHVTQAMHEQFASKPDFNAHVADNDKNREILHERVNEAIRDYNQKFQDLPGEIIALLRNAGALKNFRGE